MPEQVKRPNLWKKKKKKKKKEKKRKKEEEDKKKKKKKKMMMVMMVMMMMMMMMILWIVLNYRQNMSRPSVSAEEHVVHYIFRVHRMNQ